MSSKYDGHQIAEIKKSMMLAGISTSDIERAINHLIGPIFKFNDSEVRVCDHGGSYYPTFEGKGYGMRPLRLDEMSSQAQDLFDCVKGFSYTKKNGPDRGDLVSIILTAHF